MIGFVTGVMIHVGSRWLSSLMHFKRSITEYAALVMPMLSAAASVPTRYRFGTGVLIMNHLYTLFNIREYPMYRLPCPISLGFHAVLYNEHETNELLALGSDSLRIIADRHRPVCFLLKPDLRAYVIKFLHLLREPEPDAETLCLIDPSEIVQVIGREVSPGEILCKP